MSVPTPPGSALTLAERVAAAACLVYPFRIFLTEVTGIDLHLGLGSFVALGVVAVLTVRERPAGFPTSLDLGMIAFALIAILDFGLLTGPTRLATKGLAVTGRFVAFYFLARLLRLRAEFAAWLFAAIAAVGIAEAVVGALDYHLGWGTLLSLCGRAPTKSFWKLGLPRLYSFAMDPLSVGYIFVLALAGCVFLASSRRHRALVVVGLFTIWQALPLTLSRAPVAFAVLLTIGFAIADAQRGRWFAKVSVIAVAAAALVYSLRGWNQPLEEYASVGGTLADTSAAVHERDLRNGLELIWEQPLGYGLGEAGVVALYEGGFFPANETHYVTVGVQMGVPGIVCFLWIVATSGLLWIGLLGRTETEASALGRAGSAIWFALAAGGLVSGTWSMLVPEFYFWMLTGTAANLVAARTK